MPTLNTLAFGYEAGVPTDYVGPLWGARLIYPRDLVWDRQSTVHRDADLDDATRESECKRLHDWLNGGALRAALDACESFRSHENREAVLYEDEVGTIVGNPNGSYGYVYIAAWLKVQS